MSRILTTLFLAALLAGEFPQPDQVQALIATIESLQKPVEDFRCEFDGTIHFKGKLAAQNKFGRGRTVRRVERHLYLEEGRRHSHRKFRCKRKRAAACPASARSPATARRCECGTSVWNMTTGMTKTHESLQAAAGHRSSRTSGRKGWHSFFRSR